MWFLVYNENTMSGSMTTPTPGYDSKEDTLKHIQNVQNKILFAIVDLGHRASIHDQSKLESPEKEVYDKFTPLLAGLEYGSHEYKNTLKKMQVGIDHHYANNPHHPEYYVDGINGMNLLDLVEMLCDWKAAGERHKDKPADIFKSIEINAERFKIDDQLKQILLNTAAYLYA
jgi:hypothetical protein